MSDIRYRLHASAQKNEQAYQDTNQNGHTHPEGLATKLALETTLVQAGVHFADVLVQR